MSVHLIVGFRDSLEFLVKKFGREFVAKKLHVGNTTLDDWSYRVPYEHIQNRIRWTRDILFKREQTDLNSMVECYQCKDKMITEEMHNTHTCKYCYGDYEKFR